MSSTPRTQHLPTPTFPPLNRTTRPRTATSTSKPPPKPSLIHALISTIKSHFDPSLIRPTLRGALPPLISLALIYLTPYRAHFTTLCYLAAICAALSRASQPRAIFLESAAFTLIAICLGAATNLLIAYCAVSARLHTPESTSSSAHPNGASAIPGASFANYNPNASAVTGVWLFFNIMVANAVRFARPQLQTPVVIYTIQANVGAVYIPTFANMAAGISFVSRLMTALLAGLGTATVVNLFVLPGTCRHVLFNDYKRYIEALRKFNAAQKNYLLQTEGALAVYRDVSGDPDQDAELERQHQVQLEKSRRVLKDSLQALSNVHGKVPSDLTYAKREIAIGRMRPHDLSDFMVHLRNIFIPLLGLGSALEIVDRIAGGRGWAPVYAEGRKLNEKQEEERRRRDWQGRKAWSSAMQELHEPFRQLSGIIDEGLQHVAIMQEWEKPTRKVSKDTASASSSSDSSKLEHDAGLAAEPGTSGFLARLDKVLLDFAGQRNEIILEWCKRNNVDEVIMAVSAEELHNMSGPDNPFVPVKQKKREQLFILLYVQFLLFDAATNVKELVKLANHLGVKSSTPKRLLLPGRKRLRKWFASTIAARLQQGLHEGDPFTGSTTARQGNQDFLSHGHDPEHLDPTTGMQRVGDKVRKFTHIFRSAELAFGFRVAVATLCIGIVALLESTQAFFIQQRLMWAMIMVSISMSMTTGSATWAVLSRVAGTFIALVVALAIWYIAGGDGTPGAVYPLLYISFACLTYLQLKAPKFLILGLIMQMTQIVSIGYEIQVRELGIPAAITNGQEVYPIYLLAVFRLACVSGGCFLAFIFTYFPYPLTARSALRHQLAKSILNLARYYNCVHTTINIRLAGQGLEEQIKGSAVYQLGKVRTQLWAGQVSVINQLLTHLDFTQYEFALGGRFPREQYGELIDSIRNIHNCLSIMSHSSHVFLTLAQVSDSDDSNEKGAPTNANANVNANASRAQKHGHVIPWHTKLAHLASRADFTSERATSFLTLLASSLMNGMQLPPYLEVPALGEVAIARSRPVSRYAPDDDERIELEHVVDPGYAAYTVTQVAAKLINDELVKMFRNTKFLVGEVDFHVRLDAYDGVDKKEAKDGEMVSFLDQSGRVRTRDAGDERKRVKNE